MTEFGLISSDSMYGVNLDMAIVHLRRVDSSGLEEG